MSERYILDGRKVVPVDYETWTAWVDSADRRVAVTEMPGVRVSTVFLKFPEMQDDGSPLAFETLVTGGVFDGDVWHSATWAEALADHKAAVELVTDGREEA